MKQIYRFFPVPGSVLISISTIVTISLHPLLFNRAIAKPTAPAPTLPAVSLDRTQHSMVTSAHPLATAAGLAMLQQGGNAIDAAVATTLAISVVEPFSAGIGGGGFLLMYQAKPNTTQVLDFRERAPQKASRDMYRDRQGNIQPKASVDGHRAVAVPGTIAGLYEAHRRYGRLPWKTVVAPAVKLAATGFPVSHRFLEAVQKRQEMLLKNPEARRIFTRNGQPYQLGQTLVQAELAKTLQRLADRPADFYTGQTATAIVQDMTANGGLVSAADLQQYRPTWRQPLCGKFRKMQVCTMPPPSSGGVHLLEMLNIIGEGDLKSQGWHHADTLHLMAEAMRIAYADRATHLGDPEFIKVPVKALTSPQYAQQRRQGINWQQATPSSQVQAADPKTLQRFNRESTETSHLNVVDNDRNAVSLTFTINLGFGAGVVAKGTGIVLNNEMDDFASAPNTPNAFGLPGSEANSIAPRKIPLSSMTPTIVTENGRLKLTTGAPGGSTIITTVLQVLLNVLVYDLDIQRAIAAPRIHHQWLPDQLQVERWGLDAATITALQQRGHRIATDRPYWGNANGIVVLPDGSLEGAADPRGEGLAAGW